jgi:uncharacterized membrane protein YozB (DUF420 family)
MNCRAIQRQGVKTCFRRGKDVSTPLIAMGPIILQPVHPGTGGALQKLLNGPGFLGTHAPFVSDLSLMLILLTAILFTIGWQLARHGHYEIHRWVQTVAVILNTIVVLGVMIGSYVTHILPGIPGKLITGDYAVTTVHALVGLIGLLLGIFVVLRGNELVPEALRFKNYKLFMRTSYAFYMLATLLGVIVYLLTFVFHI